jgi:hypothetical protein
LHIEFEQHRTSAPSQATAQGLASRADFAQLPIRLCQQVRRRREVRDPLFE